MKSDNKEEFLRLLKHIEKKCPQYIEVYCIFAEQEFPVENFYTCEVRFWIIGIDYMTISDFQGRHDSGEKNNNVHALRASDMTTKFFPIHLCKVPWSNDVFEGNLKLIKISFYKNPSKNRLKGIGAEIFKPLKFLKYVNFQFNECINQIAFTTVCITDIEKYIYENCPSTSFSNLQQITKTKNTGKYNNGKYITILEELSVINSS